MSATTDKRAGSRAKKYGSENDEEEEEESVSEESSEPSESEEDEDDDSLMEESDEDSRKKKKSKNVTKGKENGSDQANAAKRKTATASASTPAKKQKSAPPPTSTTVANQSKPPAGTSTPTPASNKKPKSTTAPSKTVKPKAGTAVVPSKGAATSASGPSKAAPAVAVIKSTSQAREVILQYIQQTNRPYGAINVFDNLHKRVPKATVQSLLDKLSDEGMINRKDFGKAKVYFAKQAEQTEDLRAQTEEADRRLKSLKEELSRRQSRKAGLEAEVNGLNNQMTDEELTEALKELEKDNSSRATKLESLKRQAGQVDGAVMAAKRATVLEKLKKSHGMWVKRRRAVMNAVEMVADGMEKKASVVLELMGLETDSDAGFPLGPPELPSKVAK